MTAGADPNVQSSDGFTVLMSAAAAGHSRVVQQLLREGVDPNVQNSITGHTALIHAVVGGHFMVVKHLLAAGADPNVQDQFGGTALGFATSGGDSRIVQLLEAASRKER